MNSQANSDINISGESACPGRYTDRRTTDRRTRKALIRISRHDIAFIFSAFLLVLRQRNMRALRLAGVLVAVVVLEAGFLMVSVPNASITPGPGSSGISPDGQISVRVNRFSSISQASVYVNGEQRILERGIEGKDFTAPVDARPGSSIFVEIRVESAIGVEREMSSSFTTMEPEILP